jgi:glucose/arabinose dehydrogenase
MSNAKINRTASHLSHIVLAALFLTGLQGCGNSASNSGPTGTPPPPQAGFQVEVFLNNLNFPVTLAFAPDGRLFFNELDGNVRVIENGVLLSQAFATLPVATAGERGLIGLAFDPQFTSNGFVYVLYSDISGVVQHVARFNDLSNVGVNQFTLIDNLPSADEHNGGNIGFGTDGNLYVTIGDNFNPANSQDENSLSGKILRYNPDGTVPSNNPFGAGNPAFNLGLRNSFDFTFHPQTGTIYASENGPNCDDELNRIVAGENYGWRPGQPCGDTDIAFIAPLTRFNPVSAPTGVTFYTGSAFPQFVNNLFLVDFLDGRVRRFAVDENQQGMITETEILVDGGFGSLLDIVEGPDGFLYFSSETAIMRIVPQ